MLVLIAMACGAAINCRLNTMKIRNTPNVAFLQFMATT
ncbi:hypothetical protein PYCH_05610 [Pyrococcus yayanosii CH1]|uniref:Uncharacterized protein n=1 Tax=Pyrococcus yayanosii (strain CH1 / JCM 16557) TaxID=529709 RepID=F8AHW3_PYRYC|nr:hypothetical protein PYCH_05610 [Pyrococcus yayanosii CH1]